jgi:hypothetical protein
MVHALHEAWRVLLPKGILIDLRPLCADAPLEIVFTGGCELAGPVDMSPEIADEIAADQAIESVVKEELFKKFRLDFFDFAYYWNTIEDMLEDMDEYWQGEVILRAGVVRRARGLFKKRQPQARVRLQVRMKLEKFERVG